MPGPGTGRRRSSILYTAWPPPSASPSRTGDPERTGAKERGQIWHLWPNADTHGAYESIPGSGDMSSVLSSDPTHNNTGRIRGSPELSAARRPTMGRQGPFQIILVLDFSFLETCEDWYWPLEISATSRRNTDLTEWSRAASCA